MTSREEYVLEIDIDDPMASRHVLGTDQPPKTIVGYCWPWTGRPGEQIDFKVSTYAEGEYQAELVRIICGDSFGGSECYKEKQVPDAAFAGQYAGRHQPIALGSCVHIPSHRRLDRPGSFTVQTLLFPTCLPSRRQRARGGSVYEQHLVSRWDPQRQLGWALLIDDRDRMGFKVGGSAGVHQVSLDRPLTERHWYLAVASLDAAHQRITLMLECHSKGPAAALAEPTLQRQVHYPADFTIDQTGPLGFAACCGDVKMRQSISPQFCFNGRLDRVRLSARALELAEARSLCVRVWSGAPSSLIGFWDFAADIDGIVVRDCSGNNLHGTTVNAPMRAVPGVEWDGSSHDWRVSPDHYSAIHFHDDDLYDAQWETDFRFRIPDALPSGVYAAKLRHGQSEDYVPFFVAPPKGTTQASVALLLPTVTYTAYTNYVPFAVRLKVLREGQDGQLRIEHEGLTEIRHDPAHAAFLANHAGDFGAGVYRLHTDGTLRTTASQKYPNLSTKPKGMNWTLVADTYLIDWLEHEGIVYDILTDDLLHREGVEVLKNYRVVMTGNHPEYYSKAMLDAVSQYQALGGRWMYLGGNGFYWVTSVHAQLPGLIEARKYPYVPSSESHHAFDGIAGGLWRDHGRTPQQLMGVGTSGITLNSAGAYRRLPGSYDPRAVFIFQGVHNEIIGDFGVIGGGAAGEEVDRIGVDLGTPVHALHLARADGFPMTHPEASGSEPMPAADMVFFEGPRGGAVFSVGSMAWVGALSHNNYNNDIARITENVLRRFTDGAPFEFARRVPR